MATGDTLLIFHPLQNEPPASDPATPDARNLHPVLDFQATSAEAAIFTSIMPRHYGGNGITVYIHYAMSTATSGNIDWLAAFERIGDQQLDIDDDSFAAAQATTATTVAGTAGLIDIVNIVFTNGAQMDSIAVGESFRMKITRDAPNDTASGDSELLAIEIKET